MKITVLDEIKPGVYEPSKHVKSVRIIIDEKTSTLVGLDESSVSMAKTLPLFAGVKSFQVTLTVPTASGKRMTLAPNDGLVVLNDDQVQTVSLVRVPVQIAKVMFRGSDKTSKATLYSAEGRFLRTFTHGGHVMLRVGKYKVVWTSPGENVSVQWVSIDEGGELVVSQKTDVAKPVSGQLLDSNAAPVGKAAMYLVYLDVPELPWIQYGETDEAGRFRVPIDKKFKSGVVFQTELGGKLVEITGAENGILGEVRYVAPVVVEGEIGLPPAITGAGKPRVIWFDGTHPHVQVGVSPVDDGKVSAMLQPGKYTVGLYWIGRTTIIGSVTVPTDKSRFTFQKIEVNNAMWESATSMDVRIR